MLTNKGTLNFLEKPKKSMGIQKDPFLTIKVNVAIVDISNLAKKEIDSNKWAKRLVTKAKPLAKQLCIHYMHEAKVNSGK